jgi:calcineurin-like phosphoesterase family protein
MNIEEKLALITENTFIVSDTHFGHGDDSRGILLFEPCRLTQMLIDGYKANEHDQWMIDNWNATVKPNDVVLHLGDFAFKQTVNKKRTIELFEKYKHLSKEEFKKLIEDKDFDDL